MLRAATLMLLLTLGTADAAAQLLPLTVPRGKLRFDFSGRFESFDFRWNDGAREEWAADFSAPLDRAAIPSLAETEARLKQITGLTDVSLGLGRTDAAQLINLGTMGFGGAVGVTRWLTIFGTVPFVQVRARTVVTVDSTGSTAGFNPADPVFGNAAGLGQATAFFGQLATALGSLRSRIAAGDFDNDPNQKALAQQILARGEALELALFDLIQGEGTASAFLPRSGTTVANALTQLIRDFQNALSDLPGGTSFSSLPPLPSDGLDDAGLAGYLTNPDGPIAAAPFDEVPAISYIGDIEVGAVVSLLDRYPVSAYGRGIRAALETTVRLPTARLDDQNRLLDVGTGDRQPDIEVALVTDIGLGRFGVRLDAGYNFQLAGNQSRRVAPPGQLAPANTLADLRRDPGDVVRVGARPFFRIAPHLMVSASLDYRRQGTDVYEYVAGQPPIEGGDLSTLAVGSRSDALLLGAALTFSHGGLNRFGVLGMPLDASARYQRVASSSFGRLAASHVMRIDLRFYTGAWQ